jgi:hydrogenase expression/formation protein HypD
VVSGFDPDQIVAGVAAILEQLAEDKPAACTVYPSVSADGNAAALQLLQEVFTPLDVPWRALGVIPGSGLALRPEFEEWDAEKRFKLPRFPGYEMPGCRCGHVLGGRSTPQECPLFGVRCTPRDPVGPCMVSSEGACAAAFKYERRTRRS